MGVKGSWLLLRNKGHAADIHGKPSCPTLASKIRVDVCGSQLSTIRYAYSIAHSDTNNAHRRLEQQLIKLGKKDELILYVDGHPAAEKANTHHQRKQNLHKARDRAYRVLVTLEDRLQTNKRIHKHHVKTVYKKLASAFSWTMKDRWGFVDYMANNGYEIILCATEADVKIATDCQEVGVVVTGDSDLLFYKSVPVVWRPMGRGKSRRYLLYDKATVLNALDVTSIQLVTLAIISGNDYTGNIPTLGIETNRKLIKKLEKKGKNNNLPFHDHVLTLVCVQVTYHALTPYSYSVNEVSIVQDEASILQDYLTLPEVIRKTCKDDANDWTFASFDNALKVFVTMKQDRAETTAPLEADSDATPIYDSLRALLGAQASSTVASRPPNMFATVDKPSSVNASTYRPRYSAKVRYEPTQNTPTKEALPPIKPQIHGHFERKQMLDEMMWKHPRSCSI
ncbi:hypothetical protein BGZ47_009061 [Haplosporangium gracile]|nr:hypothetical protein BGZ47_009061 [Haplosporangium gracile]